MQRSGVLYQAGRKRKNKGEVVISSIVDSLKATARLLRRLGTLLILISIFGLGIVYGPLAWAEMSYYLPSVLPASDTGSGPSKLGPALRSMPTWKVPDNEYSIYVPKIKAISKVVGNVDAANEKAYLEALTRGVAEAANLAHPGEKGTTYLFAHSTDGSWNMARYNAVFYLLDKVQVGDAIEVVYKEQLFSYKIAQKQILPASDLQYLIPQDEKEILVLQTCYPPGTSWKRLVVVAEPI